jgi:translation initiation factor 2 beta subunit (eIF-2beta)/eIF-5
MFNAMTFKDAKSFMIVLLKELESRLHTSEKKLLQQKNLTDDELAKKIAKTLRQLSEKT